MKGYFDSNRKERFPTQYEELRTAAHTDVLEAGFILAFVILAICFYMVMPALKGKNQLYVALRVTISLFIGGILMTSNFGLEWETAHIYTKTAYKAGSAAEIHANIGMNIGLRAVNITLVRDTTKNKDVLPGEMIDYNEEFSWTWDQGRFGFGPFAGHIQQDFRRGQLMGLPLPILWIADYFTIDGEGLRFGRFYRTAGWYTHIALWSAFPCWLLANIMFSTVVAYGAVCTLLTGFFQVLACILWASIRNPYDLVIPFEDKELRTKFGVNFWLTLVTGIICIILGIVILFLDTYYQRTVTTFFGIDDLTNIDEKLLTNEEYAALKHETSNSIELGVAGPSTGHARNEIQSVLQRRSTIRTVQKGFYRKPVAAPRTLEEEEEEQPVYSNVEMRIPRTIAE